MPMTIISALLLAAQALALPQDQDIIAVEVITGSDSSGWTIATDGHSSFFDYNRETGAADPAMQQRFVGEAADFAFARSQLARYRPLAQDGDGCPIARTDVFGFRLTWVEHGARHTATFTDSCGGIPSDLNAALRPIGQRVDRYLAMPPTDVGGAED